MAIMIPETPHDFDLRSHEDVMFYELEKLSDSYYVFHSFFTSITIDSKVLDHEIDFVVFNQKKGMLCIEAKAGNVDYDGGYWRFGSGKIMPHGGPFRQSVQHVHNLLELIDSHGYTTIKNRCKIAHAVWFPDAPREKFLGKALPADANLDLLLTEDSFGRIEQDIERIFELGVASGTETNLSNNDVSNLLAYILAPSFNMLTIPEIEVNHNHIVFKQLLREQVALLNYLEEQRTAVINGLAGTGKTAMAIEKALKHAKRGEKVLFLCYNKALQIYLETTYNHENISFYTIDGFCCSLTHTDSPDYDLMLDALDQLSRNHVFPYQHVVIDEGQDFGKKHMEETQLIEYIEQIILEDEQKGGTFYIFYDRHQLVQADEMPEYITNADCKLTLYKNCRNTENIAVTSMRLLGKSCLPKFFHGTVSGQLTEVAFASGETNTVKTLNTMLDKLWDFEAKNITILTCKTEHSTIIRNELAEGYYLYRGKKFFFTTCRKFKGLESNIVILIDINSTTFGGEGSMLMYVGSSRARDRLLLLFDLSDEQCKDFLASRGLRCTRNVRKDFATAFNAKLFQPLAQ